MVYDGLMLKLPKLFEAQLIKMDVEYARGLMALARSGEPTERQVKLAVDSLRSLFSKLKFFRTSEALLDLLTGWREGFKGKG